MNSKNRKNRIVNLVFNSTEGDAGVQRVSQLPAERGHDVVVCSLEAKGEASSLLHHDLVHIPLSGADIVGSSSKSKTRNTPKKPLKILPSGFNNKITQYLYCIDINNAAHQIKSPLKSDIVICNNFERLRTGHTLKGNLGVPYVYDAHELKTNRSASRSKIQKIYGKFFEWHSARQADAIFTVSKGIGKILPERVNLIDLKLLHKTPYSEGYYKGATVKHKIRIASDEKLFVYIGAVTETRKPNILIEMLSFLPKVQFCFAGNRDEKYHLALQELVKKLGVDNRVWFGAPVHHEQVVSYISRANLSFVLIPSSRLSYKFLLPNKFSRVLFQKYQSLSTTIQKKWSRCLKISGKALRSQILMQRSLSQRFRGLWTYQLQPHQLCTLIHNAF